MADFDAKIGEDIINYLQQQKDIIDKIMKLVEVKTKKEPMSKKKSHKAAIKEMKMPVSDKKIEDITCLCNFNNKLDRLRRKLEFQIDTGGPTKMITSISKDQLTEWVELLRDNPEIEIGLSELEILRHE